MANKFDGIIEAVRYKNGQILTVRAYERRGAAFSDRIMLDRDQLLERIRGGKKFLTGVRMEFWAGTFEEGLPVMILNKTNGEVIATNENANHDELERVPVF